MNMLKKGPELKVPEIKVPDFLLDLYYDLRERHLLPLVGILLVAIVALPVVLSGSSDSGSAQSEDGPAATASAAVPSSELVVAKAAPGLREYRRRLAHRRATDPFVQQYTELEGAESTASSLSESVSSSEGGSSVTIESTPSEPTSASPEGSGSPPPQEGNGEPSSGEQLRYYSFAIDVRIVPTPSGASDSQAKPTVRHNLPELTMLPSQKEPALTFMDVSKDGKKALMLVSDQVTGLFGDGVCVVGTERCQLLSLEQGIPETVVYGPQERTFRIELLKLRLLTTAKLHKAPLGDSNKQKGDEEGKRGSKPGENPAG